jgi:hypothetical protein
MLHTAAFLIAALGIAHSILGERYILIRLFRRDNLPRLFGGTEFTVRTLRFAWHVTTVLAFGFAIVLFQLAGQASAHALASAIGWTLVVSGLLPLVFTRGRHLSWLVFFLAGGLCLYWAAR